MYFSFKILNLQYINKQTKTVSNSNSNPGAGELPPIQAYKYKMAGILLKTSCDSVNFEVN